jgi:hypothetical protein
MTPILAVNMADAHAQAGERALMDLRAAKVAPALFKPEWTERAAADYAAAERGMGVWSR